MTTFSILFIVFAFLAWFHFVWEAIIGPSARAELRYQIFDSRDKVRHLKVEKRDLLSDELFEWLQGYHNKLLLLLHGMTLFGLIEALSQAIDDDELTKRMEYHENLMATANLPEIYGMRNGPLKTLATTLFVNSGGWIPYGVILLIPFFIVIGAYFFLSQLKSYARKLLELSDSELQNLFPPASSSSTI